MSVEPVVEVRALGPARAGYVKEKQFSFRSQPDASGAREYVGDSQVVTATFPATYTPGEAMAVSINLDYTPSSAMPRSSVEARIYEVHDADHTWTPSRIWLASDTAGVTATFLVT